MYEYKFTDGEGMKTSSEELKEKIKQIDDKYKLDLAFDSTKDDIALNLERLEHKPLGDEELKKQAEESLKSYVDTEQKKIDQEYFDGNKNLDEKKDQLNSNYDEQSKQLDQNYLNAKENNKNSFIRRGLSRSSIMQQSLSALDDEKTRVKDALGAELKQNLEKISIEKDLLETQKQSALESFNIAYAVKLSDKINKLTQSEKKAEEAITKYNNQIEEREKKFILSQKDQNIAQDKQKQSENKLVMDFIDEYGRVGLDWFIAKEKLEAAKKSIKGLNKQQAFYQIERDGYRDILGDNVYKSLVDYINNLE